MAESTPTKKFMLIGNIGAGKTTLFNKLTGKRHATSKRGKSCTQHLTSTPTKICGTDVQIIDSPGYKSGTDIIRHIAEINAGLELELDGLIVVVKANNRNDLISNVVDSFTELLPEKAPIRLIIAQCDKEEWTTEEEEEVKAELCKEYLKGLDEKNVLMSRKDTKKEVIAQFLLDRKYPKPRNFKLGGGRILRQLAAATPVAFKPIKKKMDSIASTITVANTCMMNLDRCEPASEDRDHFILYVQALVTRSVLEERREIWKEIEEIECETTKNMLYGSQIEVTTTLEEFTLYTNRLLSYYASGEDGIFAAEYRQCPKCDRVWCKEYGCENVICGNYFDVTRSREVKGEVKESFKDSVDFKETSITFDVDGDKIPLTDVKNLYSRVKDFFVWKESKDVGQSQYHTFNKGSGCGYHGKWTTFKKIEEEKLQVFREIGFEDEFLKRKETQTLFKMINEEKEKAEIRIGKKKKEKDKKSE
mmetsp:Transcript_8997/g.13465  ORF Transcript_8997/g.13465 Transcript_8997/m.13465 type:complete len:476 (+) Transcript_8997:62-1489(+)|eukprot:CAMPEP_0167761524 /NCGR_PEP_ID=MMETSP0110_2-20121227/12224_1 /TAXON_ID=629695 /ORGANISM="Gymnochlora sp., Strain CCMP2014" /LENGTH=475 /DNA_ID=CAMNT_0007648225 /DNA_START=45 /DNA_END=1472 /DNA_ORIENTATION=+